MKMTRFIFISNANKTVKLTCNDNRVSFRHIKQNHFFYTLVAFYILDLILVLFYVGVGVRNRMVKGEKDSKFNYSSF